MCGFGGVVLVVGVGWSESVLPHPLVHPRLIIPQISTLGS